jgi:MoaA/NifB/PqqE/SkfB family radical SAM enzyme
MRINPEIFNFNGKIIQLIHDLVIEENRCNLQCDYCMKSESPFNRHHEPLPSIRYADSLRNRIAKLLDQYSEYFDAPILKMSGGEILLLGNVAEFIKKHSENYETVQVLTNGLLITPQFLKDVSKCRQLAFQISIDGHEYAMNSLRVKDKKQHQLILHNIETTVQYGFNVEIYCVLHKKNVASIIEFADYIMQTYAGKVILTVFPVRHKAAEIFGADKTQLNSMHEMIAVYDRFESILPPRRYLTDLLMYMSGMATIKNRCYCPFIMMQSIDDGSVTPCPYSWIEKIGNVLSSPEELVRQFGVSASYHLRTMEKRRTSFCKNCFTDAYNYSLFFNDAISLHELVYNKIELQRPLALKRLSQFKEIFTAVTETTIKND